MNIIEAVGWAAIAIAFISALFGICVGLANWARKISNYWKAKDLQEIIQRREVRIGELQAALAIAQQGGPYRVPDAHSHEEDARQ